MLACLSWSREWQGSAHPIPDALMCYESLLGKMLNYKINAEMCKMRHEIPDFFHFFEKNKKSVPIETKKNLYRNRKLFV